MAYKIVGDSCTDLPIEFRNDPQFSLVPLTLMVDDITIRDDNTFNQAEFLRMVAESPNSAKSACPSPEDYMNEFDYDGDIYVVTISGSLSGSYNSAVLAKRLYLEEHPDKKIEIIDSKSASVGQALISIKIRELIQSGYGFETVIQKINAFRDEMKTKFVLENLDTLRKNGRLTGIQAMLASALNIKPVMGSNEEGAIIKLDQARGISKALSSMVKYIEKDVVRPQERTIAIAHCNNYERALYVKEEILKRVPFRDSFIVDTAGVSTMYANDGGIITAY